MILLTLQILAGLSVLCAFIFIMSAIALGLQSGSTWRSIRQPEDQPANRPKFKSTVFPKRRVA